MNTKRLGYALGSIFLITLIGLVALGALRYQQFESRYREEVNNRLAAIADLKASELTQWRSERRDDGDLFYQNPMFTAAVQRAFAAPDDADDRQPLETWMRKIQAEGPYDQVRLLDATGATRLSLPEGLPAPSLYTRAAAEEAQHSGQVLLTDLYRSELDERNYEDVVVPLFHRENPDQPLGTLVLRIDPQTYLYPYIARWPVPSLTAETLLIRRDGSDALFLNDLRFNKNAALLLRIPLSRPASPAAMAARGQRGIIDGFDYRGVRTIAYVRAVPDSPWILIARMDSAEVYAPLRIRFWETILLEAALLFGLGTGLAMIWRHQRARYYRERYETAEALRSSEENLKVTLNSIGDAVIATDAAGRVARMNPIAERLTGWAVAEAVGRPITEVFRIINSITREPASDPVERVLADGAIVGLANHTALISRNGAEFIIADSAAPIRHRDGGILGVVLIFRDVTDQEHMHRQVLQNAARFRELFDDAPVAFNEIDQDGILRRVNRAVCTLFGYTEEELVGQPLWILVAPAEQAEVRQRYNEKITGQRPMSPFQRQLIRRDGAALWFEVHETLARDEAGNIIGVRSALVDITARKRAEETLRESEYFLARSQEIAEIGSYKFDIAGDTWICTPTLDRIFGIDGRYPKTSASWLNLVVPAERESMRQYLQTFVVQGGQRFDRTYRINRPADGAERWVHGLGDLELAPDGRPRLMFGTIQDITERRRADEALAMAVSMQRAVFNSTMDMIWAVDSSNFGLLTFNESTRVHFSKHFGHELALGQSLADCIPDPEFAERWKGYFRRALDSGPFSVEYDAAAGGLTFLVSVAPVQNAERTFALSVFARNITARKQAEAALKRSEEQLRQAQKMEAVGQLAGGVAHDFNNILAAVLMHLSLLQVDPAVDPSTRAALKDLETDVRRGTNLTRQLLAFSRQQAMEPKLVDLKALLYGLLKMLRRLLGEHIELAVTGADGLPRIKVDPGMIEQVVINLCVNARDAMPNGGRIAMGLEAVDATAAPPTGHADARPGAFVRLRIADTGTGMDEHTLRRLFEPFFTTKGFGKGTGLGLATVYGIVKQHGGWVEVQSTLGVGSAFVVYLPIGDASGDALDDSVESSEPLSGGNENLLLVEDEASLRAVVATALTKHGYRVLTAGSGPEALQIWKERREEIDLILTDMVMPGGMNGPELAERLQAEKSGIRVIICTGYSQEADFARLDAKSRATILRKPFDAARLLEAVRTCLDSE